jgi:hypothetical protein
MISGVDRILFSTQLGAYPYQYFSQPPLGSGTNPVAGWTYYYVQNVQRIPNIQGASFTSFTLSLDAAGTQQATWASDAAVAHLASGISASATSVPLSDGPITAWPLPPDGAGGFVPIARIDSEIVGVTPGTGLRTLTLADNGGLGGTVLGFTATARGACGTTAASHSAGAKVTIFNRMAYGIIDLQNRTGANIPAKPWRHYPGDCADPFVGFLTYARQACGYLAAYGITDGTGFSRCDAVYQAEIAAGASPFAGTPWVYRSVVTTP